MEKEEKMELFFVTCGQSEDESQSIFENPYSGSLSQLGRSQAASLNAVLEKISFNIVLASPLERAYQTLQFVRPDLKAIPIQSLSAFKMGALSQKSTSMLDACIKGSNCPVREFKVQGADCLESFRIRIKDFIVRLAGVVFWEKKDGLIFPKNLTPKQLPGQTEENSKPFLYPWQTKERSTTRSKPRPKSPRKRALIVTHESWVMEMLEYIADKNTVKSPRIDNSESLSISKHEERIVPKQLLEKNKCSLTVIEMTSRDVEECKKLSRLDISDDALDFKVLLERDVGHHIYKPKHPPKPVYSK